MSKGIRGKTNKSISKGKKDNRKIGGNIGNREFVTH